MTLALRKIGRVCVGSIARHDPGMCASPGDQDDRCPGERQGSRSVAQRQGSAAVGAHLVALDAVGGQGLGDRGRTPAAVVAVTPALEAVRSSRRACAGTPDRVVGGACAWPARSGRPAGAHQSLVCCETKMSPGLARSFTSTGLRRGRGVGARDVPGPSRRGVPLERRQSGDLDEIGAISRSGGGSTASPIRSTRWSMRSPAPSVLVVSAPAPMATQRTAPTATTRARRRRRGRRWCRAWRVRSTDATAGRLRPPRYDFLYRFLRVRILRRRG